MDNHLVLATHAKRLETIQYGVGCLSRGGCGERERERERHNDVYVHGGIYRFLVKGHISIYNHITIPACT